MRLYDTEVPLVVDLDGTLVKTDTLLELLVVWIKQHPFKMWLLWWWLRRGKAYVKNRVAVELEVDEMDWPYREEIMDYLRRQKVRGRKLYLATASDQRVAQAVNDKLHLFEQVWGSDGRINLSGQAKAELLVNKWGDKGFDYVGDARRDLPVWEKARQALVVSDNAGLIGEVEQVTQVTKVWPSYPDRWRQLVQLVRCRQWVKNVLLFVPAIAAHQLMDLGVLGRAGLATLAFSLMASSVYVVNDLFDIPADRKHVTKKERPLAAGGINVWWALLLIPLLMVLALGTAWWLPVSFRWLLGLYLLLNLLYTWRIKRLVGWDVLVLVGLYCLRIYAGGAATRIEVSDWLMAFAITAFLSLALVKRYTELLLMDEQGQLLGRGYRRDQKRSVQWWGVASGYGSVLVLAMYVLGEESSWLYAHEEYLWMGVIGWWYWMNRVWGMASRRELYEDPAVWAVRDKISWAAAVLLLGLTFLAR